jgi:hypothetical protein
VPTLARAPKRRVDNVSSICGASGEHARIRDVFELPPSDWQPGHAGHAAAHATRRSACEDAREWRRCTPHGPVRPHNGCRRAPMVAARTRVCRTHSRRMALCCVMRRCSCIAACCSAAPRRAGG